MTTSPPLLHRRDILGLDLAHPVKTCGYVNGNLSAPRIAGENFKCVVDDDNGFWGFCRDEVSSISECSMYRACTDTFSCSTWCGRSDLAPRLTCTESGQDYCASDLMTASGSTYSWLYCDFHSRTISDALSAAPEFISALGFASTTTSELSSPSATPSSTLSPGASSTSSAEARSNGSTSNVGGIVGGVVGGLGLLVSLVLAFFLFKRRGRKPKYPEMLHANAPPEYVAEPNPQYKYGQQLAEMQQPLNEAPAAEDVKPVHELPAAAGQPTRGSSRRSVE
ncbi:hypothetical protein EJ04DRAFT_527031 [Polyplosphaeria fusca]|uniref:Uncharacterized protein n=1 Tax=Polyplosphaeria fusca TaxID=682080 RepID=A0A9P4QSZ8_9PLEO|nr:hypothetical protein EJ04DRAFT_527031 [Polyplosphaeria fusca]